MSNIFGRNIRLNFTQQMKLWQEAIRQHSLLEVARHRIFIVICLMMGGFFAISIRLTDLMIFRSHQKSSFLGVASSFDVSRANIVDRKGVVLATNLLTASVYANPQQVINPKEAAQKLAALFPEVGYNVILKRILSGKGFVWIARHIPPKKQRLIYQIGIPGIYLKSDQKRVYPLGALFSHVLGNCGIDGEGLSGIENFFNKDLQKKSSQPLVLSLRADIQHIVRSELLSAIEAFKAKGGNAVLMDCKTGEILSMVSLPDFDPNIPINTKGIEAFNRNTLGVYEPGSVFKILNAAIALESGTATLNTLYDARFPVQIGRFRVTDFKGKKSFLTLSQVVIYSSNIGSIKIAQQFGKEKQKTFFKKFGVFEPIRLEIPEIGYPIIPKKWTDVTMMTASYGYGLSVTPLQFMAAVNGIIKGSWAQPTLRAGGSHIPSRPILSQKVSAMVRELMRLVVVEGSGRSANVPEAEIIGKTGTAYQAKNGRYQVEGKSRLTSFIGAFPKENPAYILLVQLQDAEANEKTHGYATAGWNAAPTAGKIFQRIIPVLGFGRKEDPKHIAAQN